MARSVDRLNDWIGSLIKWLTLLMILVGAFNALARYLGRYADLQLSSTAYIELQWYLFSLVFLLGAAYALNHDVHVRVDVMFSRLSPKGRAWIDLSGTVLFLLPFCFMMLWVSWPAVVNSWSVMEGSPDPGGLPRYPIKSVILICFGLLVLQGFAQLVKQVAIIRGYEELVDDGPSEGEASL
jgi:TRAP-type mannitol/chloroaromatic compound transport system permease small subunit